MNKARVLVLVSGGGTNLQALIDYSSSKDVFYELCGVISSKKDAYALVRASSAGIKTDVVSRGDFSDGESFCEALSEKTAEYSPDFIVLAGFMCILSPSFISRYTNRIINVHPSLIPAFCGKGFYGLKVHEAALAYGVKISGATVHLVNEVVDGGRILAQKAVQVSKDDTPQTLQLKIMKKCEWVILPRAVNEEAKKAVRSRR